MQFEFQPTLETRLRLYRQPRDMRRFRSYMGQMMGGDSAADMLLPVSLVDPMGQAHCLEAAEALLAAGAEDAIRDGIAVASSRLGSVPGRARVCLSLLDDVKGGWKERYAAEAGLRFGGLLAQRVNRRPRYVIVPAWSSERPSGDAIYADTLAACYRQAWRDQRGLPRTLDDLVQQEGAALLFADIEPVSIPLSDEEIQEVQAVYDQHRGSTDHAVQFAFVFGDGAADVCGYAALGVPAWGGLALALHLARQQRLEPVALLHAAGGSR